MVNLRPLSIHLFAVNLGASARCLEIVHPISTIRPQCTVIWNYRTLFGVETPTLNIVHSILADHSFNLDVNALVGIVHTISAKRKTISAESIQFRKC